MRELTFNEIEEVSGGGWPAVAWAVVLKFFNPKNASELGNGEALEPWPWQEDAMSNEPGGGLIGIPGKPPGSGINTDY